MHFIDTHLAYDIFSIGEHSARHTKKFVLLGP